MLAETDASSSSPMTLIGTILGVFCAVLVLSLVVLFVLYRRRRKALLELASGDWKEVNGRDSRKVEMEGIIDDQDESILENDADVNPATPIVKVELVSRLTITFV